jgi:Domain of unknown function (DUF397)
MASDPADLARIRPAVPRLGAENSAVLTLALQASATTIEEDVIVGLSGRWRKSSLSERDGCLEARLLDDGGVGVRDSKDRNGPILRFSPDEWQTFLAQLRNGAFDLPSSDR